MQHDERKWLMTEKEYAAIGEKVAGIKQARKNKDFTQVYAKGWKRLIELMGKNPGAAMVYAFLANELDPSCGAVVCDQRFLASQFKVSQSTISRRIIYLEKINALVRIPIGGNIFAYALDPAEVWRGYDTSKPYAAFVTKTLVNKDKTIQRRIKTMLAEKKWPVRGLECP